MLEDAKINRLRQSILDKRAFSKARVADMQRRLVSLEAGIAEILEPHVRNHYARRLKALEVEIAHLQSELKDIDRYCVMMNIALS